MNETKRHRSSSIGYECHHKGEKENTCISYEPSGVEKGDNIRRQRLFNAKGCSFFKECIRGIFETRNSPGAITDEIIYNAMDH